LQFAPFATARVSIATENLMTKLNVCKRACLLFLLWAGASIASQGQTFTILTNFNGTDGASPGSLVQGTDGNFHGTSAAGANGVGTIFKVSRTGALSGLSFCTQIVCAVGFAPEGGLVQTFGGNFYGTTSRGGAFGFSGLGTVFRITQKGHASALYSFCARMSCFDGADPSGALIEAMDQNLYGVTRAGGDNQSGTVFNINPGGILATLYSFCRQLDCADGAGPESALVQGPEGAFYGTTPEGGIPVAAGTIFKITSAGVLTTLYTFSGPDGDSPSGSLIVGSDGNLYGTTAAGGTNNSGTIFKITRNGQLTTLYQFCIQAKCADGISPSAPLVQTTDGSLYGTSRFGGSNSFGTIFRMTPQGAFTTLHNFDSLEGAMPGPLLQATDGNFYGTLSLAAPATTALSILCRLDSIRS
jgi:uncharacterized repeat protein (TIGR03803 family)